MSKGTEESRVEEQILLRHAALKTHKTATLGESNFEDFAKATGTQLLTSIPDDLKALHKGVLSSCARLEFSPLDTLLIANAWVRQTFRTNRFDADQWPSLREDFGMTPFDSKSSCTPCPKNLGLYAVLPDAPWIKRMAEVGVRTLQLRFKSEDPYLIEKEIEKSVQSVQGLQSLLFINDHWELALKHGAYGVHLGQEDLESLSPQDWTRIRESGLRLGISTHGYSEMIRADVLKPSYIAMGAVFATTLKKMQTPPQGLARLKQYALLMKDYPLVAIGGITEEDFPGVLSSGVGSVAVVRAIIQDIDPEQKAGVLGEIIQNQLRA